MRTTVTLEDDVAAAVARLREERSLGLSEAVNTLIRDGLRADRSSGREFRQRSRELGLRIDVSDVARALAVLEGDAAR